MAQAFNVPFWVLQEEMGLKKFLDRLRTRGAFLVEKRQLNICC